MSDDEQYGNSSGESGRTVHEVREDSGPRAFDPASYVRQLRGRGGVQDYLDVKFRLLWLRREHPDAEIITEHIRIDENIAIFRATVSIPGGGKATGHGSETAKDFPDYIEKAETKALGRALNALGYGAQFAEGEDPANTSAPSRVRPPAAETGVPVAPPPVSEPAVPVSATPPERSPEHRPAAPPRPAPVTPVRTGERRAPSSPAPTQAQPKREAPVQGSEPEPPLEDYSWTAFWRWAREQGFDKKAAIEEFLGRPIQNLSPAEVRQLIIAKRSGN